MSSGCGDVISLEDMKNIKLHQTFEAEVITGRTGGVASGAEIDTATNSVTGRVQKTLPAILRDMGFAPVGFDFSTGGTVVGHDQVVYNPADGNWYSWAGALPKVVAFGENPLLNTNWKPRTDQLLRQELAQPTGADKVGLFDGGTVQDAIKYTTPEMFGAIGDGIADDTVAVREAINTGKCLLTRNYKVSSTINIPSYAHVRGNGSISFTDNIVALSSIDTDHILLEEFRITGLGKGGDGQTGILLGGNIGGKLIGIAADGVSGYGIRFEGGRYIDSYGEKIVTTSVSLHDCTTGMKIAPNMTVGSYPNEYCIHTGIQAAGCNTGIEMGAGNHSFSGGHITGCIDGLVITAGYNSAHGTFTGVQFNHNSRFNLHAISASAGLAMSACTFFGDGPTAGIIYFEDSRGFVLDGCMIEASIYTDGAFSWNKATNCYNNGNFTMLFAGTHGNRFIVDNWVGQNGPSTLNNEGWDYVAVNRSGAQSLTESTDTTLIFNGLYFKNIQQAYDLATGAYTAPFTGFYSVNISAKFLNASSGYCSVKVDGGVITHLPVVAQSGGMCSGTVDVYMNTGQILTITANIAGASPQHDGTGGVSRMSIRKF